MAVHPDGVQALLVALSAPHESRHSTQLPCSALSVSAQPPERHPSVQLTGIMRLYDVCSLSKHLSACETGVEHQPLSIDKTGAREMMEGQPPCPGLFISFFPSDTKKAARWHLSSIVHKCGRVTSITSSSSQRDISFEKNTL